MTSKFKVGDVVVINIKHSSNHSENGIRGLITEVFQNDSPGYDDIKVFWFDGNPGGDNPDYYDSVDCCHIKDYCND